MGPDAASREGLCWRPWPCEACRGGNTPLGYLSGCRKANPAFLNGSIEAVIRSEIDFLRQWATGCPHTEAVKSSFCQIAQGSEHCVYFDEQNGLAFKATKPGLFGESYFIRDGKVTQKNCSPFDYLVRLRLWMHVFESAPEPLGITQEGQIVSSHQFITGRPPEQSEVDAFLEREGFIPVRKEYWLWEKPYEHDAFAIGLGDARADNFVATSFGIVPIDVRLWISPEERLRVW